MCDIDNRFLRSDAIHGWDFIIRQLSGINGHADSAMRVTGNSALGSSPLEDRQVPGGPLLDQLSARIVLILETQKNQMPSVARGKTRHLHVIAQYAFRIFRR